MCSKPTVTNSQTGRKIAAIFEKMSFAEALRKTARQTNQFAAIARKNI